MYIGVEDIMKLLDVSQASAYRIIIELNNELKNLGYFTLKGKTSRKYFTERFYINHKEETYVSLQR